MIQVIIRALDILDFVAQHGKEPVKLINIAKHLNIGQPTCANIIKTLVSKNYLENVSRNEGYRLGSGAFHLTGNLSYSENLISKSKSSIDNLMLAVNETALLAVLRNHKRHLLYAAHCDQDLQVRVTNEADIYNTASGRLLLAFLSEKELENMLRTIGLPKPDVWAGILSKEDLKKALREIKGNEMVHTLTAKHIVGIAVPVYKHAEVVAGLSIFLPESRYTIEHASKLIKNIQTAAKKITEQLEKEE